MFAALRRTHRPLTFATAMVPRDSPVPAVVGEENEDAAGAVVFDAMVRSCADAEPFAEAAVESGQIATDAPRPKPPRNIAR